MDAIKHIIRLLAEGLRRSTKLGGIKSGRVGPTAAVTKRKVFGEPRIVSIPKFLVLGVFKLDAADSVMGHDVSNTGGVR